MNSLKNEKSNEKLQKKNVYYNFIFTLRPCESEHNHIWLYFQSHHKKDPLKSKHIRLYTKTGQNGK